MAEQKLDNCHISWLTKVYGLQYMHLVALLNRKQVVLQNYLIWLSIFFFFFFAVWKNGEIPIQIGVVCTVSSMSVPWLGPPRNQQCIPTEVSYSAWLYQMLDNYRLITAYLLLRVNLDKIMHTRWDFDASSAQASKLKCKCIILSKFSSTK